MFKMPCSIRYEKFRNRSIRPTISPVSKPKKTTKKRLMFKDAIDRGKNTYMQTPMIVEKMATVKFFQGNLLPLGSTLTLTLEVFECSLSRELEMFWNIKLSIGAIEDKIGISTANKTDIKVFRNSA